MSICLFWFDSLPDDERSDTLALHASHYQEHAWNGFHVPLVTAAEFTRFIAAWGVNDPNGDWVNALVTEVDGTMVVDWGCGQHDVFVPFDAPLPDPVYGIDGFAWSEPTVLNLFTQPRPRKTVFNSEHLKTVAPIVTPPRPHEVPEEMEEVMTPKNRFRMPLREKLVLATLALVVLLGAAWLADPEADAAPPVGPPVEHCQAADGRVCDPIEWLLGPPPVAPSGATSWQDMMLPPEAGAN